jgi:hypothetical protein
VLDRLMGFDADAVDLEDGGDDEPDADDEPDGMPPMLRDLVLPKVTGAGRPERFGPVD